MIWRKRNPWPQQLMTALVLLACFLHDSPAHLIRHGQPDQAEAFLEFTRNEAEVRARA